MSYNDKLALPGPGPSTAQFRAHLDRLGGPATGSHPAPSELARRIKAGLAALGRRRKLVLLCSGLLAAGLLVLRGRGLWTGSEMSYADAKEPGGAYSGLWSVGEDDSSSDDEVCGLEGCADEDEALDQPKSSPGDTTLASSAPTSRPWLSDPSDPLATWGLSLSPSTFISGIPPISSAPNTPDSEPALSPLGHFADNLYQLGSADPVAYRSQLEDFVRLAFPTRVAEEVQAKLDIHLDAVRDRLRLTAASTPQSHRGKVEGLGWRESKRIWQTDKDNRFTDSPQVSSWRKGHAQEEGWVWELVTDQIAAQWIEKEFAHSRIEQMWNAFPSGILRSDALRYLALALRGGIYTDTDTELLKAPSRWGRGAELWQAEGWASAGELERIAAGESADDVLGPPAVVVGVEADVGDREDWHDWWPRPMQLVQWTMAAAPAHPICVGAVMRVLLNTGSAVVWAQERDRALRALWDNGEREDARERAKATVLSEPKEGGPLGIMAWTGPGVWTDSVLAYLWTQYGLKWTDLKDLRKPLRVGDVVVLPVTGFSPGVGNFGADSQWSEQAMVNHLFRGSWKSPAPREPGRGPLDYT